MANLLCWFFSLPGKDYVLLFLYYYLADFFFFCSDSLEWKLPSFLHFLIFFFFPLSLPKPFLQVMLTVSFLTEWLKNTVWWYTNWDECPDTWKNQVWNRVSVTTWEECLYAHQVLIRSHTNWYSIYLWELLCL